MLYWIESLKRNVSCVTTRDLGAQRGLSEITDVVAVDRDAAAGDVVEARHQVDQGRLARAAHAHERHHLAAPDVQRRCRVA